MGKFFGGLDKGVSADKKLQILAARINSLLEELDDIQKDYARIKAEDEKSAQKKWELTDSAKVRLANPASIDETSAPFFTFEGQMFMQYDAIRLERGKSGLDVVFIYADNAVVTLHTGAQNVLNADTVTLNDISGVMEVNTQAA